MSLINQMLRDLEQRRSAEAGPSPLGGLSSSGSVVQAVSFSINYRTLAAMVAVMFVAGVVVAYLLGSQQHAVGNKNTVAIALENKFLEPVENPVQGIVSVKPSPIASAPLPIKVEKKGLKPVAVASAAEVKIEQTPSAKTIGSIVVKTVVPVEAVVSREENILQPAADAEQNINKTIRPLTDEQQSQLAFQRAIKLLGRGNQPAAHVALEEALHISPNHIRARETLAALLLNDGRVSEAAGSLRDGLQLMPEATPLAKLYARILVDQDDVATAVAVLERARPEVSADPEYHALLAALYRQEKKYAQASRSYQQILMQRPAVASYWMGLALSQDTMGKNVQALDAFQRAQRVGGLGAEVMRYVQSRIVALTPLEPVAARPTNDVGFDVDELGE